MIGAENNGWRVAQATLASERGVIAFEAGERQRREIEAFYRKLLKVGAGWLRDVQLHREFISLLAEMQAARRLLRRVLEESETPEASVSVLPSIVKLSSTVLRQRICSFMVRIAGVDGQTFVWLAEEPFGSPMFDFVSAFSGYEYAGGTNEIQRDMDDRFRNRRWTLHSRSPRCVTVTLRSPRICTSILAGAGDDVDFAAAGRSLRHR